jgi:NAD(P)H-nitrite reductase large subunit
MAGGGGEYPGALGINVQLAAGLPFCAIGMANPPDVTGCSVEVSADERARTYRKLVRRGRRLVGACLVGAVDDVGKIERSIGQPTIA